MSLLLNRTLSRIVHKQAFDYFLVLDFEATCESAGKPVVNEIIEFPVLLVSPIAGDGGTWKEIDRFHKFVKPAVNPTLSSFCVQLTGIMQETVDQADPLPRVWKDFQSWLKRHGLVSGSSVACATCGNWDLSVALCDDLRRYQLPQEPDFMRKWINVKQSFHSVTGKWPSGLYPMLKSLGVQPVGRAHSGLDDALNTLQLMKALADKHGHIFQITNRLKER